MDNNKNKAQQEYEVKLNQYKNDLDSAIKKNDKYSYYRIGLFLVLILCFVAFLNTPDNIWRIVTGFILFIPIFIFIWIAKAQSKFDVQILGLKSLIWVFNNELSIINGQKNGYHNGDQFVSESHAYTSDLDIFGESSLFAYINRCSSPEGIQLLANNFNSQISLKSIKERQEAIAEVTDNINGSYNFRAHLLNLDHNKLEAVKKQFSTDLSDSLKFTSSLILSLYVKIMPYIMGLLLLSVILVDAALIQYFIFLFILNIAILSLFGSKVNKVYFGFSGSSNLLSKYGSALKYIEEHEWKSNYILSFISNDKTISNSILGLSKIIQNFDARLNILVASFLNGVLIWDLRCCYALSKWHKDSSSQLVEGLGSINKFEELISVATLKYNHPEWANPAVENDFVLEAKDLGHPLIKKPLRVVNDFNFVKKPTVDIVTGSNMAGKSTFLRTLGINLVLAYAGAPVCASFMNVSIFNLVTYMRIRDSLNENTSTFKAELNRLKMILDEVSGKSNTLVLIDEMLRGTNSRDKFLGSKVFIEKLVGHQTSALFATHDLQLSELESGYPESIRNYHFDIQMIDGEMQFDYKLKHGACKTFNADILLKQIGLSLD